MNKPLRAFGIAIAAVTLSLTLAGCGSDSKTKESTTTSSSETSETTTTKKKNTSTETSPPQASGPNYTIVDYIRDNGIVETPVHRGDPGTPTLNLPIPQGWADAEDRKPEWAWGAIVSTDPAFEADPPSVIALMSKLTGNVNPAKILEYAPNEIKNLPGYESQGEGSASTLGGFDAYQIGAVYVRDGARRVIAQKTVVIPGQDGLYVLQLNADGLEDQLSPLMDATSVIDEQTTITP